MTKQKCLCGGTVSPRYGPGRTWPYHINGQAEEIPAHVLVNQCETCGETYTNKEKAMEIDSAIFNKLKTTKLYAQRNVADLDAAGGYYTKHIEAMTSESLVDKSDIAAELAWRDMVIDRAKFVIEHLYATGGDGDK